MPPCELLYEGPVGDVVVVWQLVCAPLFPGRPPGTEGGQRSWAGREGGHTDRPQAGFHKTDGFRINKS